MAFTVEDGSGITGANAYITVAEADTYFSDRGITTWTGDDTVKQVAIIKATDFIETRFGSRFAGQRKFTQNGSAKSVFQMDTQPTGSNTVDIDGTTFTFGTDVAIETRLSQTLDNLVTAINSASFDHSAEALPGQRIVVTAGYTGPDGNAIAVSTNKGDASWTPANFLGGGNDELYPQSLSFPRSGLYFPGTDAEVVGVPTDLKSATAEYALRALTSVLIPDPTRDDTGNEVTSKREKVGPIEEETQYLPGLSQAIPRYPAADKLLSKFLASGGTGGVIR